MKCKAYKIGDWVIDLGYFSCASCVMSDEGKPAEQIKKYFNRLCCRHCPWSMDNNYRSKCKLEETE